VRSAAEEARTLVAAARSGALATLCEDGAPWASYVEFGLAGGTPVLTVSTFAEHGRNLEREPRASLLVANGSHRVTLSGHVERRADGEALPPPPRYGAFGDFSTWVLRVERVRWIGGFGRMASATAEEYHAAEPDPVAPTAGRAVAHLNDDHPNALLDMARVLGGLPKATAAYCDRADRYGIDLVVTVPDGQQTVRVPFAQRCEDAGGLRAATVELARRARGD
jgi:putative heme iron utilization protein